MNNTEKIKAKNVQAAFIIGIICSDIKCQKIQKKQKRKNKIKRRAKIPNKDVTMLDLDAWQF